MSSALHNTPDLCCDIHLFFHQVVRVSLLSLCRCGWIFCIVALFYNRLLFSRQFVVCFVLSKARCYHLFISVYANRFLTVYFKIYTASWILFLFVLCYFSLCCSLKIKQTPTNGCVFCFLIGVKGLSLCSNQHAVIGIPASSWHERTESM